MADEAGTPGANVTPLRPKVACPQCGRPADKKAYPFCSKRCADLDLGAWLSGSYVVSGSRNDDD